MVYAECVNHKILWSSVNFLSLANFEFIVVQDQYINTTMKTIFSSILKGMSLEQLLGGADRFKSAMLVISYLGKMHIFLGEKR